MATVIAVDVSVSMVRQVEAEDAAKPVTLLELATHGINRLLDHLAQNSKYNYVSVITFSSECDVLCPFTRDYESIRTKVAELDFKTSTCYPTLMQKINDIVLSEWANSVTCNVIMITDESCYEHISKPDFCSFLFPGKLKIAVLEPMPSNKNETKILLNCNDDISVYKFPLTLYSVAETFDKIAEEIYSQHNAVLRCGNLKSDVQLIPSPVIHTKVTEFEIKTCSVPNELNIIGFLEMSKVNSPGILARHLVLPQINLDEDANVDSDVPSFHVLLQKSLKAEDMAALCELSPGWYGLFLSWTNKENKSNLILALLEIGSDAIPWLGDLQNLTLSSHESETSSLQPRKNSYNQPDLVWINNESLQAEIRKLLRIVKRMPDKTQSFYKKLNQIRFSAIAFSFVELLLRIAEILENERVNLPPSTNPECDLQLAHAATELRSPDAMNPNYKLRPAFTRPQSM